MDQHSTLGILLCGGESRRMGKPKALLNYHEIPQWVFAANLLAGICDAVAISIHSEEHWQEIVAASSEDNNVHLANNPISWIVDDLSLGNNGPATALYTVGNYLKQNPRYTQVLVLGIDYPALAAVDLQSLIVHSQDSGSIVSFANTEDGNMEPLIACYPANHLVNFSSFHSQNPSASPRRYFQSLNPTLLTMDEPIRIKSIDTPELAEDINKFLAQQSKA